jgi:hypothetical protein
MLAPSSDADSDQSNGALSARRKAKTVTLADVK